MSIKIIILISFATVLGSNIIIIIASFIAISSPGLSEAMLWVGFTLLGFGFGPIYPGIMSFTESYIKLTDLTISLFIAIGSVPIILSFYLVGHWIAQLPIIMIYFVLACVIVSFATFIGLIIFIKNTAKPIDRKEAEDIQATKF